MKFEIEVNPSMIYFTAAKESSYSRLLEIILQFDGEYHFPRRQLTLHEYTSMQQLKTKSNGYLEIFHRCFSRRGRFLDGGTRLHITRSIKTSIDLYQEILKVRRERKGVQPFARVFPTEQSWERKVWRKKKKKTKNFNSSRSRLSPISFLTKH